MYIDFLDPASSLNTFGRALGLFLSSTRIVDTATESLSPHRVNVSLGAFPEDHKSRG